MESLPELPETLGPARESLKRRILRGTIWSTVGRAASMGALILANVMLAWAWKDAKGDFAAYAVAAATVVLLGFPASVGAPKILTRIIREGVHSKQYALLRARLLNAQWLLLLSCSAICAAVIVAPTLLIWLGVGFSDQKWSALTSHSALVAAWLGTSALCMAISQALMGFDDFRTAALVGARNGGVISNVGFLAISAACWATGSLSLATALWIQSIVNAIALLLGFYWLRRAIHNQVPHASQTEASNVDPAESGVSWLFHESWPNLVIQVTSMGILPVELLLVSSMASDDEIADYTAVQRLQEVLVSAQTLTTIIVAPFITELFTRKDLEKLQLLLRGAATLVAVPTIGFLLLFILIPEWTLRYSFGPTFIGGAWPLRIASLGAAAACLSGPNGLTMIMVGRQRELLKASVAACLIYLAVAPLLIYQFGIVGAAVAVSAVFGGYNIVVTLLIKSRIGVWTTPTLSPRSVMETWRQLKGRRSRPAVEKNATNAISIADGTTGEMEL